MEIKKVLVVGAGQMGGGIAQVAAQAGLDVILNDIKQEFVDRGLGIIAGHSITNTFDFLSRFFYLV